MALADAAIVALAQATKALDPRDSATRLALGLSDYLAGGQNMVVTEAIAGLSAIKTALDMDMAKALENIHEAVARDRAVFELQREILSAQQAQFALVDRIRDLDRQIADFDEWKAEKKRYEMKEFGGGTIAYALKSSMANGEPPHNLCCKCYNNGKKGVLQSRGINAYHQQMVKCSECDTDLLWAGGRNLALAALTPRAATSILLRADKSASMHESL